MGRQSVVTHVHKHTHEYSIFLHTIDYLLVLHSLSFAAKMLHFHLILMETVLQSERGHSMIQ